MDDGNDIHLNGTNGTDAATPIPAEPATGAPATALDYSTDFPALPNAEPAAVRPKQAAPAWTRPASKNTAIKLTLNADERASKGRSFGTTSEEQQRCMKVSVETDTRIELCEAKDGTLTVFIRGEKKKVEEARAKVVRELQTQATKEISVPKEHHGMLIGREGSKLKELEAETNTRIAIPGRDSTSDVIKITGPREGMERAAARILQISTEQSRLATENIPVARAFFPWVRGPNNELVDELTRQYSIKINIPPPSASNEVIVIQGEREGVLTAAAKIRAIVAEKSAIVKTMTCTIARAQHRFIIGKQRSGIADILRETGVSVEIPEAETSDVITLRGDPARLSDALARVYERASSTITKQLDVPHWMHRLLIGRQGATLQALVPHRDKVQIDFEDDGAIIFEGSPEEVKSALAAISNEIARIEREMTMEKIKVHPSLHRHVIGRGGSLVSKLKDEHDVSINIPDEATNSDEITVEGKKEGVKKAIEQIRELVTKIENEKSKDIIVEQRLHKLIIGQRGENIQKVRAQYPSVNFSFPDLNKKSDIINIRGDKVEVDNAAKALQKIVKELLEANYQESVPIFKEFYKHIVGKGGSNIRKIREETQTKIDLPEEGSSDEKILVTGKKENVAKAIERLTSMQNELASVVTVELEIPVKVQARMLGGGRRIISDIEKECGGVHIKFPAEKSESTKVTIVGPKDDVEKARKVLSDLAKDREANFCEDKVTAKPEFHRFLIGKGGSRINKIRENGVRVMFPHEGDTDKETIHLLGTKEDVAKAKKELEALIQQLNETVEIKTEVDPKYHAHFRSRGAAVLREIQDQNGNVVISFPARAAEDQRMVTLKGIKQCVESAKARIEEIVEDLEHHVSITVEIPAQHHRTVLANRGQRVQELQSRFNVRIHFPRRQRPDEEPVTDGGESEVRIEGRDTACESAKIALLALVPIEKIINVPYEMHSFLIGRGGETIRKIMQDSDVHILVPKGEQQSEEIIVSGTEENVENALIDIRSKIKEYEDQAEDRKLRAWSMTLAVPAEFHQKIIGTKGATVNALRAKHDVNIALPRGEEKSDEIIISGYEEKARACAEEIEALIADIRSQVTQEMNLDARCHPRIIGARGKNVRKLMDDFGVEIRFPRGSEDPNVVYITGKNENSVFDCIDHLRNLEEDFLAEFTERKQYLSHRVAEPARPAPQQTVEIRGAPWQNLDLASVDQFPEMGAAAPSNQPIAAGAWGAARRF